MNVLFNLVNNKVWTYSMNEGARAFDQHQIVMRKQEPIGTRAGIFTVADRDKLTNSFAKRMMQALDRGFTVYYDKGLRKIYVFRYIDWKQVT